MQKLIAGLLSLTLWCSSGAFARAVGSTHHPHHRHYEFMPLAPHQQPREANAPDNAIGPTVKEKAIDSKINNICRGC
jgi:hypothetical protein